MNPHRWPGSQTTLLEQVNNDVESVCDFEWSVSILYIELDIFSKILYDPCF